MQGWTRRGGALWATCRRTPPRRRRPPPRGGRLARRRHGHRCPPNCSTEKSRRVGCVTRSSVAGVSCDSATRGSTNGSRAPPRRSKEADAPLGGMTVGNVTRTCVHHVVFLLGFFARRVHGTAPWVCAAESQHRDRRRDRNRAPKRGSGRSSLSRRGCSCRPPHTQSTVLTGSGCERACVLVCGGDDSATWRRSAEPTPGEAASTTGGNPPPGAHVGQR